MTQINKTFAAAVAVVALTFAGAQSASALPSFPCNAQETQVADSTNDVADWLPHFTDDKASFDVEIHKTSTNDVADWLPHFTDDKASFDVEIHKTSTNDKA